MYGQPDVPIQRSHVDNLPYATIRAKMGRSGRVLMVLGRYDGSDLHWISADYVALVTRNGRVVKSAGLANNLKNTEFVGQDPVGAGLHHLTKSATFERLIDIELDNRYAVPVRSRIEPAGEETIEILEQNYTTQLYRETNMAETIDWHFTNYFWVDPTTGFVWKSRQHFAPSLPPVEIEILKPAG